MTGIGQRSRSPHTVRNTCAVSKSLEVVGDRWTLLLLLRASEGIHRFEGFRESLGIARNILSGRLRHMVEEGLFERVRYQTHPDRYEYRLMQKGLDLAGVLSSFRRWGDRWLSSNGEH
jgi:DNA-binding HxlR family transcriptional regulator